MRAQCGSVWLSVWFCAAAALSIFAQTGNQAKLLSIGRFEAAPVIDGKLDEPVWREAAALRDFRQTQPGDNTAPSYPTLSYNGYSSFTNQFERGLRRNQRTFFIKMSYLIRRGL
jgi:hypothetical protein